MADPSIPARCGWSRVILHADMDAFYAAIEQLDDPALRGKPVLVGGRSMRGVVMTASYEARPFGVGSAMPMARALRACPEAVVVPPRFERYQEVSREIMGVFRDFSPEVEAISLDEAFVDMTGAEGIFGSPASMGANVKAAVREATGGLTASVGVANTKFVAKVASDFRKPDGLTVVAPEEARAFLDPLPVKRLWGVGPKSEARLAELGLSHIADIRRADPTWLAGQLGGLGRHIYRLAHNQDDRPVTPNREPKSIGAEHTLERDVVGAPEIAPHLLRSADRIAGSLRRKGYLAGGVRVKLKTRRFKLHTRQSVLPRPTDHGDTLYQAALALLSEVDLDEPMRLVGMAAYDLSPADAPRQTDMFDAREQEQDKRLDGAIDALEERFGKGAVERGSEKK